MRAVIQRAKEAEVRVANKVVGTIGAGLVVFVGVEDEDKEQDVAYLVKKISKLRIFEDDDNKMNLSVQDVKGEILSISQFTLHADTRKGNRPSFTGAAKTDYAKDLYNRLNNLLEIEGIHVETGQFGEHMEVDFINDGPVTILIDSKNK
ncbi:MAG: D-aminoacyl-tRNA deacylase [Alkalibacterium gilvum]|uniref:D-aminoacyl-tRNA deacylase n=1 Tax=Alkalibacterium gilvum TaxID=1130080 RepID=A0A1H6RBZ2_9LACT|nr:MULTISPECIES: D-aminoacyl-tRNA deacylase [Alkalibacterium]MDN6193992.1 D-aminoacyl-tRNA deacylase [Alkalibacterium sp.]MDN6293484.1 D-aminoacyl-tRNA deacylase [Alkalibacterium sp.]MDN6295160.1 D-aminoacyl-tRNA deacylase [Alkalibacterium sp.]MDN6398822.1 D-aminoacyl-tRNA deacylase [Alkalibacterium sp.]MDN6728607.1 D-aminoacyl-tRNA deacylase [Alkalibacterium sp.]